MKNLCISSFYLNIFLSLLPVTGFAMEELQLAAATGDAKAQFKLGRHYLSGKDINEDRNKGFLLLEMASNQGHGKSASFLAMLLMGDDTRTRDANTIIPLFEKAAAKNIKHALFTLAAFHKNGYYGLPVNLKIAANYYQRAALLGNVRSAENLSQMYNKKYESPLPVDQAKTAQYFKQALDNVDDTNVFLEEEDELEDPMNIG